MKNSKNKNGVVHKSDVLDLVNNYIRNYVTDKDSHEIIFVLYKLVDDINDMPVLEAN